MIEDLANPSFSASEIDSYVITFPSFRIRHGLRCCIEFGFLAHSDSICFLLAPILYECLMFSDRLTHSRFSNELFFLSPSLWFTFFFHLGIWNKRWLPVCESKLILKSVSIAQINSCISSLREARTKSLDTYLEITKHISVCRTA